MRGIKVALALSLLAGVVDAEVGSVISSFRMSGYTAPYANGIYRGASHVYAAMHTDPGTDFLFRFTTAGSLVSSVSISRSSRPYGMDRCHLGDGYVTIIDPGLGSGYYSYLLFINKTTGSMAASFSVFSGWFPRNVMWDGAYYHVAGVDNGGVFTKYTTAGSTVGSYKFSGWPSQMGSTGALAYATIANGLPGSYLVASPAYYTQPSCIINMNDGSLIATFMLPFNACYGGMYGESSAPATFGAAYWICETIGSDRYAVELDIGGRNEVSVLPASVGKIKAVYR